MEGGELLGLGGQWELQQPQEGLETVVDLGGPRGFLWVSKGRRVSTLGTSQGNFPLHSGGDRDSNLGRHQVLSLHLLSTNYVVASHTYGSLQDPYRNQDPHCMCVPSHSVMSTLCNPLDL